MNLEVLEEHDLLYAKLKVEKPSIYLKELNQRTNGPVNAHLISWPSTYKTWKIYGYKLP